MKQKLLNLQPDFIRCPFNPSGGRISVTLQRQIHIKNYILATPSRADSLPTCYTACKVRLLVPLIQKITCFVVVQVVASNGNRDLAANPLMTREMLQLKGLEKGGVGVMKGFAIIGMKGHQGGCHAVGE